MMPRTIIQMVLAESFQLCASVDTAPHAGRLADARMQHLNTEPAVPQLVQESLKRLHWQTRGHSPMTCCSTAAAL